MVANLPLVIKGLSTQLIIQIFVVCENSQFKKYFLTDVALVVSVRQDSDLLGWTNVLKRYLKKFEENYDSEMCLT